MNDPPQPKNFLPGYLHFPAGIIDQYSATQVWQNKSCENLKKFFLICFHRACALPLFDVKSVGIR
jgi:hypothetical protein